MRQHLGFRSHLIWTANACGAIGMTAFDDERTACRFGSLIEVPSVSEILASAWAGLPEAGSQAKHLQRIGRLGDAWNLLRASTRP